MAEIVTILGVPHTPLLWRRMVDPIPDDLKPTHQGFLDYRERLAQARPDVIVFVASDHFRQFFADNMPAFLIGKAPRMHCTHPNEVRHFGLPTRDIDGDPELARWILGPHELPLEMDFSFSDELWLDHSIVVPLLYLTPDFDIPVVPVFTNTGMPPVPRAHRFATLGAYLRKAITAAPVDRRVALVGTGHLAQDLGGPRQFSGTSIDIAFDEMAVRWMAEGDLDAAVAGCTYERVLAAGNVTPQFLNFITLLAAANQPAAHAAAVPSPFSEAPFFAWEPG